MPATAAFDQMIGATIAAFACLYVARTVAGLLLWACATTPGRAGRACRRASARVTPRLVRRLLAAALGATALGGSIGAGMSPATAVVVDRGPLPSAEALIDIDRGSAQAPRRSKPAGSAVRIERREGRVFGRRPIAHAPGTERKPGRTTGDATTTVTVKPGDCLWTMASRRLGHGASNSDIDREWRRWYRLNERQIGPNPDLVRTGIKLRVPA